MTEILEYDFAKFTILFFILLSIILFAFLKTLKIILPRILKKRLINIDIIKHYSTFELLMWLVFLFWSLPYFYRKNIYYAIGLSLIIATIILWIGWFALRDIVAGFIVRNNAAIKIDNKIIFDNQIITISKLCATLVEGRLKNGNTTFIKYNKLFNNPIQKVVEHELTYNKTIEITTTKTENPAAVIRAINGFLLTQPNYAIKHQPEINKIGEKDQKINLRITFFALNTENIVGIEYALREKFEG